MSAWPRLIIAALVSLVIVALAYRRGSLSRSGSAGAMLVGTVILGAGGLTWGVLLALFFFSSSGLSAIRPARKRAVAAVYAKGPRRDLGQVLANGGLAALAAALAAFRPDPLWLPLFVGALAAATADTWSTELGVLSRRPPRLITTGRPAPAGTSGAVSLAGLAATLAGGCLIGLGAGTLFAALSPGSGLLIGAAAGLAGSLGDSLLGATVQRLYVDARSGRTTEKAVNALGEANRPLRGWGWMTNDTVNLAATFIGALVAGAAWWGLGG